jgi:hypothetical protein
VGIGGVKAYLRLILPIGCIAAINQINLKELLSIIQEAQHEENVLL